MSERPNFVKFEYVIILNRLDKSYSPSYNVPEFYTNEDWALRDVRLILEGKDLEGNTFEPYKVIDWESLEPGKYSTKVEMILMWKEDLKQYEQAFRVLAEPQRV